MEHCKKKNLSHTWKYWALRSNITCNACSWSCTSHQSDAVPESAAITIHILTGAWSIEIEWFFAEGFAQFCAGKIAKLYPIHISCSSGSINLCVCSHRFAHRTHILVVRPICPIAHNNTLNRSCSLRCFAVITIFSGDVYVLYLV